MAHNVVDMGQLRLACKMKFNGLFTGLAGCGKTETIKALFTELYGELGVDWLYFSASTLDPWVDIIGVPDKTALDNGQEVLTLIRPAWVYGNVRAIFFDEPNRAPEKVRNALMELLQFKSINGHRFEKLEVIWAARNPEDEEHSFDVERMDPALEDRFQLKLDFPYQISRDFFKKQYGDMGLVFCDWWDSLKPEGMKDIPEVQKKVSPRRVEYLVKAHQAGLDLGLVVSDPAANIPDLERRLAEKAAVMQLDELLTKSESEQREAMSLERVRRFGEYMLGNKKYHPLVAHWNKDFIAANIEGGSSALATAMHSFRFTIPALKAVWEEKHPPVQDVAVTEASVLAKAAEVAKTGAYAGMAQDAMAFAAGFGKPKPKAA